MAGLRVRPWSSVAPCSWAVVELLSPEEELGERVTTAHVPRWPWPGCGDSRPTLELGIQRRCTWLLFWFGNSGAEGVHICPWRLGSWQHRGPKALSVLPHGEWARSGPERRQKERHKGFPDWRLLWKGTFWELSGNTGGFETVSHLCPVPGDQRRPGSLRSNPLVRPCAQDREPHLGSQQPGRVPVPGL